MLNAFINDKSSFRNNILLKIVCSLIFILGGYISSNYYVNTLSKIAVQRLENINQKEWLSKFDFKTVNQIKSEIIRPCKESEINKVLARQMALFDKHNLKVISASNTPASQAKGSALRYISTKVEVSGSYKDICNCLNEFETQYLVVIVKLQLGNSQDGDIRASLEFNTYYQ